MKHENADMFEKWKRITKIWYIDNKQMSCSYAFQLYKRWDIKEIKGENILQKIKNNILSILQENTGDFFKHSSSEIHLLLLLMPHQDLFKKMMWFTNYMWYCIRFLNKYLSLLCLCTKFPPFFVLLFLMV